MKKVQSFSKKGSGIVSSFQKNISRKRRQENSEAPELKQESRMGDVIPAGIVLKVISKRKHDSNRDAKNTSKELVLPSKLPLMAGDGFDEPAIFSQRSRKVQKQAIPIARVTSREYGILSTELENSPHHHNTKGGENLKQVNDEPALSQSHEGEESSRGPPEAGETGSNTEAGSSGFDGLGLGEWLVATCTEMGMRKPTPVQVACIPRILRGSDVVGIAQTGSGKTAAFALPILQHLAKDPYGVFALVLTPTRELAIQLADQFRALGAGAHLRDAVLIGGLDMTAQAQKLAGRPHVVIATPGRLLDHLNSDKGMASVFARLKYLVLDEADRLLDTGFEAELRGVLECLPPGARRQTLLFSATMTSNLKALEELALGKDLFHWEAYQGFSTVDNLKQEYLFIPVNVKEVYLSHLVSTLEEAEIRSVMVFASTCRTCQLLSMVLEELGINNVSLHSLKSQPRRLAALARFRSGQASILIATDVASRGLDIPTVDLVINYDLPRFTRDYVHRVGRTARAGRGGKAVSLVTQYDVELVHNIEALIGHQLAEYQVSEDLVLKGITKVFKAKRAAILKMSETGFDDLVKARKDAKLKAKGISRHSVKGGHRQTKLATG